MWTTTPPRKASDHCENVQLYQAGGTLPIAITIFNAQRNTLIPEMIIFL